MKIKPYTLRKANEYVRKHHRHSKIVVGCKFCIAAVDEEDQLIGVAIVGRPVARRLDDGIREKLFEPARQELKMLTAFSMGRAHGSGKRWVEKELLPIPYKPSRVYL